MNWEGRQAVAVMTSGAWNDSGQGFQLERFLWEENVLMNGVVRKTAALEVQDAQPQYAVGEMDEAGRKNENVHVHADALIVPERIQCDACRREDGGEQVRCDDGSDGHFGDDEIHYSMHGKLTVYVLGVHRAPCPCRDRPPGHLIPLNMRRGRSLSAPFPMSPHVVSFPNSR